MSKQFTAAERDELLAYNLDQYKRGNQYRARALALRAQVKRYRGLHKKVARKLQQVGFWLEGEKQYSSGISNRAMNERERAESWIGRAEQWQLVAERRVALLERVKYHMSPAYPQLTADIDAELAAADRPA